MKISLGSQTYPFDTLLQSEVGGKAQAATRRDIFLKFDIQVPQIFWPYLRPWLNAVPAIVFIQTAKVYVENFSVKWLTGLYSLI